MLVFVVAVAGSFWVNSRWEGQDDAYITFQYAKRLAVGYGFSYSGHCAPSYGSTTMLYTSLLAVMAKLGWAPHMSAWTINPVCYGLSAVLLLLALEEICGLFAAFTAALTWALAWSVQFFTGGMETSVLFLLMTSLFWLMVKRKEDWKRQGIVCGLMLLTRPDTLILVIVAIGSMIDFKAGQAVGFMKQLIKRKVSWADTTLLVDAKAFRTAGVALAICLPWLVYAWIVFGSPVPNSLVAKLHTSDWWYGRYAFAPMVERYFGRNWGVFTLICAACALSLAERRAWPIALWVATYQVAMMRKAPDFGWYYAPVILGAVFLSFIGAKQARPDLWQQPAGTRGLHSCIVRRVGMGWHGLRDPNEGLEDAGRAETGRAHPSADRGSRRQGRQYGGGLPRLLFRSRGRRYAGAYSRPLPDALYNKERNGHGQTGLNGKAYQTQMGGRGRWSRSPRHPVLRRDELPGGEAVPCLGNRRVHLREELAA